ncbi:MAG: ATP synthase F1 subunit delta [Agathobacter sp.]|nr:ATP synthase F1 subunit delta [Agathobacter sp.]
MAKLVSKTYGDALFELALENNQLDSMFEEIEVVSKVISDYSDLTKLMNHPKIIKEEKIKLIEDIFTDKVSKELVGLMRMMVEKDHYNEINNVFSYFMDKVKEYKNIGTAYITSAMELTDDQKKAVEIRLLETTKYLQFEMHFDVDESLIGGMLIRIGDRVVDSSIKTKLSGLKRDLMKITI